MKDALRHPMNTKAVRVYPALSSEQGAVTKQQLLFQHLQAVRGPVITVDAARHPLFSHSGGRYILFFRFSRLTNVINLQNHSNHLRGKRDLLLFANQGFYDMLMLHI